MPLNRVKITVLKKIDPHIIFNGQIPTRPESDKLYSICDTVAEGDEFVVEKDREMPKGFCTSAWKAIGNSLSVIQWGGDYYPNLPKGTAITCCPDGIRPVSFKLVRLEK
ncbi:MAG: TIGR04076 family protein [Candidatus Thorarchaeota archaeon]|jgi:uncharacterized repeat protein (TIGR04076 family)